MAESEIQSLADFIQEDRQRKNSQALAQSILGRGARNGSGAGSIASNRSSRGANRSSRANRAASQRPPTQAQRSGVQKQRSSSAKPNAARNINDKWEHDLHAFNQSAPIPGNAQRNGVTDMGFSIRGAASVGGPATVMAMNFASGTTAADIAAVMGPHGGEVLDCKIITATPTVSAEVTLATRQGAHEVIGVFNGKKADGRVLYVYMKDAGLNYGAMHSGPSVQPVQPVVPVQPVQPVQPADAMDVDQGGVGGRGNFRGRPNVFNRRRGVPRGPRNWN